MGVSLKNFIGDRNSGEYLFTNNRGGRLTTRTLQKFFHMATIRALIFKDATFYSLRHSFATQLLENNDNCKKSAIMAP